MSNLHSNSRKALTFNTAAFGISSLAFMGMTLGKWLVGSAGGFGTFALLVGYAVISVPAFIRAWKAFKDMDYNKSQRNGFIAWLYPAVVAVGKVFI